MLIRQISLKNIRSYNDGAETTVEVPEGVVLFEGDIGSGKSTLLYAVEFALFGLGDLRGPHLLSEGKEEGHVTLTFVADGKVYSVHRTVRRRGDNVTQDDCYVSVDGTKERLSPGDLKERVVSILRFKEPTHPKAESLVYRFAVFTPQEQMKAILLQNSDERLQVIRHVLGTESYEVAAGNSELVFKKLREMAYGKQRESQDLDEKRAQLAARLRELAELDAKVPALEQKEASLLLESGRLESEARTYQGKKELARAAEDRVPILSDNVRSLETQISEGQRRAATLDERLSKRLLPAVEKFRGMKPPDGTAKELRKELDAEKESLGRLRWKLDELRGELARSVVLKPGEVCPTCGQVIKEGVTKPDHLAAEAAKLEEQTGPSESKVSALSSLAEYASDYEESARENAANLEEIDVLRQETSDIRGSVERLGAEVEVKRAELADSEVKAKEMAGVVSIINDLESRLAATNAKRDATSVELVAARTNRQRIAEERKDLSSEVERKATLMSEAKRLGGYQAWLSGFFAPTVKEVETQTLAYANARFSQHFQRFFASLVDDPELTVRVKEDFSPVFERQGFEQDFEALSGGERTSMSLAYRFALNSVVREDISLQMELVILDEPTEGFSKEQVYKMRGLLEELDSRQVILVSHERELESMADHIFRVEKTNGTSRVLGS